MVEDRSQEYITKLSALASGESDPVEISTWAIKEQLALEDQGLVLDQKSEGLLEALQIAAARSETGALLYGTEDFQEWLAESQ